jgi:hypothetical protein
VPQLFPPQKQVRSPRTCTSPAPHSLSLPSSLPQHSHCTTGIPPFEFGRNRSTAARGVPHVGENDRIDAFGFNFARSHAPGGGCWPKVGQARVEMNSPQLPTTPVFQIAQGVDRYQPIGSCSTYGIVAAMGDLVLTRRSSSEISRAPIGGGVGHDVIGFFGRRPHR